MTTHTAPLDQVTLVNERDEVIGVMDKVEAHRGQAKLHRAISVFLFNSKGELLLQQRSQQKIVGAGQWANTCCGNVWPGESYEACAYRRLKDELRITNVKLVPIHKFQYFVQCNDQFSEFEMDQIFVGQYEGTVEPNPEQVNAYQWNNFATLSLQPQGSKLEFAPWFLLMMSDQKIITNLERHLH